MIKKSRIVEIIEIILEIKCRDQYSDPFRCNTVTMPLRLESQERYQVFVYVYLYICVFVYLCNTVVVHLWLESRKALCIFICAFVFLCLYLCICICAWLKLLTITWRAPSMAFNAAASQFHKRDRFHFTGIATSIVLERAQNILAPTIFRVMEQYIL